VSRSLKERVTSLEEYRIHNEKQIAAFSKMFEQMNQKLNIVNQEQGETRDGIRDVHRQVADLAEVVGGLRKHISNRVSAPMTGRDKAVLYGAAITAICSLAGTVIVVIAQML